MWNSDNPSSRNYRINTHSWVPKSSNPFWTEVHGWYNPTTISMTEVTESILNWGSQMIQSYHHLDDRSHQVHYEPRFMDDTILPPSWWPKSPDPFWTEVHRWYNPTTISMTEVTGAILNRGSRMIQSYHHLNVRSHWIHSELRFTDDTILPRSWVQKSPDPI